MPDAAPGAGRGLRCAGARGARGAGPAPGARRRRRVPAGQPPQPARADHRRGLRGARRRRRPGVRRDGGRLRRLRHRRAPRRALAERGVPRLPGAHCYEVFAGGRGVRQLHDAEPGHLLPDRLPGPALRRAGASGVSGSIVTPSCATSTSAHYRRVVHLAQSDSPELAAAARTAAARLGLSTSTAAPAWRPSRPGCSRSPRATRLRDRRRYRRDSDGADGDGHDGAGMTVTA